MCVFFPRDDDDDDEFILALPNLSTLPSSRSNFSANLTYLLPPPPIIFPIIFSISPISFPSSCFISEAISAGKIAR